MRTVNNDPRIACPNANWNGDDDELLQRCHVRRRRRSRVGPRLHRVHQRLIYQWQPGALNESYSDIWGETVDLINGRQDDDETQPGRTVGQCSQFTRGAIELIDQLPAEHRRALPTPPRILRAGVHAGRRHQRCRGRRSTPPTRRVRPNDGCTAYTNAAAVAGKFVYVDRGTCTFAAKANNAEAAGATGIIVGDNAAGRADLDGRRQADLYGLMVTQAEGTDDQGGGRTVNVTCGTSAQRPEDDSYRWLVSETAPPSVARSATCGTPPATTTRAR